MNNPSGAECKGNIYEIWVLFFLCMTWQTRAFGRDWESDKSWNEIPTSTIKLTPKSKFFIYFPRGKGWNFETKIQLKWSIQRMLFCNPRGWLGSASGWNSLLQGPGKMLQTRWLPQERCLAPRKARGKFSDSTGRIFLFSRVHNTIAINPCVSLLKLLKGTHNTQPPTGAPKLSWRMTYLGWGKHLSIITWVLLGDIVWLP